MAWFMYFNFDTTGLLLYGLVLFSVQLHVRLFLALRALPLPFV